MKLKTNIGNLELQNPVLTASGTFGYGIEFADFVDLNALGGFIVKGTTLHPREGNAYPRMAETPMGMLNAVGLQNKGVDYFIEHILPEIGERTNRSTDLRSVQKKTDLRSVQEKTDQRSVPQTETRSPVRVIVNVSGSTVEDYVACAEKLAAVAQVDAIEVNISCPNVKQGGMAFGTDPKTAAQVTAAVRKVFPRTMMVKLSPNVTDIVQMAAAVEAAGADSVSLINTLLGMAVDIRTRKPVLSTVTGGFSGPAIKPVALRMVWQVAHAVKIPVVGIGGICTAQDALEFLMAGASAIEVGSANFVNPRATMDILHGIETWCEENKVVDIKEIIGII